MKYFGEIETIEELKKAYFRMALENHPDHGGDVEIMKAINNEYAEMQKVLKDTHKAFGKDETYKASEPTTEVPEDFINIVNALFGLGGLDVELCGRWLWISGNTKEHKDALKSLGCKWSTKKKMWSWHYPEDGKAKKHKPWTMDKIRDSYGSMTFVETNERMIAGA